MSNWASPAPILAQPAETPLAKPTIDPENMELIQNWFATKFANEKPTRNLIKINECGELINEVARIAGAVRSERVAEAIRGPTRSQIGPMAKREKIEPTKEAIPAAAIVDWVRFRSWRMIGMSGGIEKVEMKQAKSDSQARWKARMCGLVKEKGRNTVALLSSSTGRENGGGIGFVVVGKSSIFVCFSFCFLEE